VNGTFLIFDETKMTTGKLDAVATKNLMNVAKVVKEQVLDYDFSFHNLSFQVDTPTLIISTSQGKGILPFDLRIQLHHSQQNPLQGAPQPNPQVLNAWRHYLAAARVHDFSLSEPMGNMVAQTFVEDNKTFSKKYEDSEIFFHLSLTLGRLMASSCLETDLTTQSWAQTRTWIKSLGLFSQQKKQPAKA
jgi:hypothetical protein